MLPILIKRRESEKQTVLLMNEGKPKLENYERLLHWRLGHADPKVLKAMDLIENSLLNEDCYCCNQAKFKISPFPMNVGNFVAVAEPYWRLFADGFAGQTSIGCQSHGDQKEAYSLSVLFQVYHRETLHHSERIPDYSISSFVASGLSRLCLQEVNGGYLRC
jgi:hypothetical protein